ncbi:MAG: terminase, partial [Candidatus Thiodiazotropha sp.]
MTDYSRVLASMDSQAKQDIAGFLREIDDVWVPQEGPQEAAYYCEADILFYGGAAGGGKTDLLLGTALTAHQYSLIMRREGTQFRGITRRMAEILGSTEGKSGSGGSMQWTYLDKLLEFGSCPDLGDEEKHQGIPHDLLGFDEITHFLEFQFRFLMTWLRSVTPGQRCRVICTGNPPTTDDGSWVRSYWAPWLDPECPIKA